MGIQTGSMGTTGLHKQKMQKTRHGRALVSVIAVGAFVLACLLVFDLAFAKGTAERAVRMEEAMRQSEAAASEPVVQQAPAAAATRRSNDLLAVDTQQVARNTAATTASPSVLRSAAVTTSDIEEQKTRVELLKDEKSKLDNQWRIERNKHNSVKIRLDDSKKTIRLEMDEVLLNFSPRERLDELLSQHELLAREEKQIAVRVGELEDELAAQQLKLTQATRDLERMETSYAAQQREKDIQRVQEISRLLDREIRFTEMVSFKCAPSKSLTACLNEYPLESRIQGWVQEHYQAALAEELIGKVDQIRLSSDWYTAQVNRSFAAANMNLDGAVTAEVDVRANVLARKMMACAVLRAPADLCEDQSLSLIVRSNKYGDQVYINNKPYGSTPLSLILDPGVYNVEVRYQGLTQKRTLNLDENRYLNFVF